MNCETKPLSPDDEEYIEQKINEYAYSVAPPEPGTPAEEQLVFKAEDGDGNLAGGCIVNIHTWGRAVLAKLWVDGPYRGQSVGSMLIRAAERAVRDKGCYLMCLGTVDYMARPFYEKHGYRVFTVNHDVPRGHESWSLSKRLDRDASDYTPQNNGAADRFAVVPGTKEDAGIIGEGLARYCDQYVKVEHDYIGIGRKLVDENGALIAGIVAGVDGENSGDIGGVWVEEAYRGQGLGSFLLREAERGAKENGAYVLLTYCCDWVSGFFFKNGFIPRGKLEDYPKGHRSFELEKRI
ncbi:MAG: GNAT family N-acetyltransferase [Clostridia bacterium]|nr:GNAT family N-acetyltransferase [Clostridia bacterium]